MLRSGMISQLVSGVYTFSPLGLKVLKNIENCIREVMDDYGALEMLMPILQPISLWELSGRYDSANENLFHLKDRHDRSMILGPTHEEAVTLFAKRNINTYKMLPSILYQIQAKFRDEYRPQAGLIRAREFLMKDAYSFGLSEEDMQLSYRIMRQAYEVIFQKLGLKTTIKEADGGDMGDGLSEEFMAGDLEVGHIFQLGTKYSDKFDFKLSGQDQKLHSVFMGCYGLGLGRIMAAFIHQNHDENGMVWNSTLAPYHVVVIPLYGKDNKDKIMLVAERYEKYGVGSGCNNILLDDRNVRPAVKFKDADLLGIPVRIVIGKNFTDKGQIEIKSRTESEAIMIDAKDAYMTSEIAGCIRELLDKGNEN